MKPEPKKPGRPPDPNARRNGARVALSPEHVQMIDEHKVKYSRSTFAEMAVEFFCEHLDAIAKSKGRKLNL